MKNILKLVLIFGLTLAPAIKAQEQDQTSEKENIFLEYCSNYGSGVSYFYQSCVNNNFSTISRNVGGFYSHCSNLGLDVDYFFISCINNNFNEVQRRLGNRVWLQYCANYDRSTLDYSFISCVNSNYRNIERALPVK